ncbi:MAG: hypothetical protein QN178_01790 [Armatimonadota bacterium]|nr:hypothetical protein [Armatimonadota bacterium]
MSASALAAALIAVVPLYILLACDPAEAGRCLAGRLRRGHHEWIPRPVAQ